MEGALATATDVQDSQRISASYEEFGVVRAVAEAYTLKLVFASNSGESVQSDVSRCKYHPDHGTEV
eukprot:1697909-Amphidinium_carterae.1